MQWQWKREWLPLAILLMMGIAAVLVYPTLPDRVPTHFNASGQPDDYSSRMGFMAWTIGLGFILYLVLTFIPLLDPLWKKIEHRYETFLIFRNITLVFIAVIFALAVRAAQTGTFSTQGLGIGVGVMFIMLGNYMPRLPRNFFFGIRTPWTLASEEVWRRSHRVGGYLFVAGGVVMVLLALLKVDMTYSMFGVLLPLVAISGFIYPYFLFKKLQRESTEDNPMNPPFTKKD